MAAMASEQETPYSLLQHPPGWGLPSSCPSCLRLSSYLVLAAVPYTVVNCHRMPGSELLPALEHGIDVSYSNDSEGPLDFLRNSFGIDLDAALQEAERAELQAFTALVDSVLEDALLYTVWMEPANEEVAIQRFSEAVPWPLSRVLAWQELRKIKLQFSACRSKQLDASAVYGGAKKAYAALAVRLGENTQFFAERPTSLDAAVFAHIIFLLRAPLKKNPLKEAIEEHPNLVSFAETLQDKLFGSEPPSDPPPFSRMPKSAKKSSGPGEAQTSDSNKGTSLRRRAQFFLLAQAASVVMWVLFSSLSIEMEDADVDDDDDHDGGL